MNVHHSSCEPWEVTIVDTGYNTMTGGRIKRVCDFIDGDDTVFERESLAKLAEQRELMSFVHKGFWQCMDNRREMEILERC